MKTVLAISVALLGSQSFAQEDPIKGRMICAVTASKFVPTNDEYTISNHILGRGYSSGTVFNLDYTQGLGNGIEIYLGAANGVNALIEEPFPPSSFKGVSRITNSAEYRTTYSEVSLDKFSMNYKGNDQLYLRKCSSEEWEGFYIQTYVSGQYIQVVSLKCDAFVDAIDDVLTRLKSNS